MQFTSSIETTEHHIRHSWVVQTEAGAVEVWQRTCTFGSAAYGCVVFDAAQSEPLGDYRLFSEFRPIIAQVLAGQAQDSEIESRLAETHRRWVGGTP